MSKRDKIHSAARKSLEKDGWTITDDPFYVDLFDVTLKADMAAEKVFAAEKGVRKIVVEVKGFAGESPVSELEKMVGQMQLYELALQAEKVGRELFPGNQRKYLLPTLSKAAFSDGN